MINYLDDPSTIDTNILDLTPLTKREAIIPGYLAFREAILNQRMLMKELKRKAEWIHMRREEHFRKRARMYAKHMAAEA